MIKIENTKVEGWEPAIRGMRNAMNSWERSDSVFSFDGEVAYDIHGKMRDLPAERYGYNVILGENDKKLMQQLIRSGSDHAKFRRMIVVWCDVIAPLYWWKEYDTYKVGTVANSCSTMHKIAAKEFTFNDFSCEHLIDIAEMNEMESDRPGLTYRFSEDEWYEICPKGVLRETIDMLNKCRELYLKTKDKKYWWQMIQLLPSSYNQKRTVMLNYEVLANIYHARKNHKLDEWHDFCDWIEKLPESWIITDAE